MRQFSRRNRHKARGRDNQFKRQADRFGKELGKACVYRLNYVIVVASAESRMTKPRELPYCVNTEG